MGHVQGHLDGEDQVLNNDNKIAAFISRWQGVGGSERANYQPFITDVLAASATPLTEQDLAAHYSGRGPWKKRLPSILRTLEALGRARSDGAGWRAGA